jgi:predicted phosphodiesterase
MKIQLMSDVHLEVEPGFVPVPAPDADVLVLAGDIGAGPNTPMAPHGDPEFCLRRFSPALGHWPVPVLYLPGNHEYDGQDFDDCRRALQSVCARLGITWLEQAEVDFGEVRLLGTTLWTDFDAFADRPAHVPGSMTHNLRAREKAFRAANYYLERAATVRHGQLFDAAAMREESLRCQQWLAARLARPYAGKTVVVTHFAPSLRSHDPRYGLTPGTAGFCSALDEMTRGVDLWLHGHLHCPSDYWLEHCRVIANPLGYADSGEQASFQPQLVLTV